MDTRDQRHSKVPEQHRATEFLENERTFLAWVRTSVTILSFGFVVARLGVWVGQLAGQPGQEHPHASITWMGVALIVLGSFLTVLAAWRYHVVNRSIERDEVKPDRPLVVLVTLVVVLMAAAMIAFVFITINNLWDGRRLSLTISIVSLCAKIRPLASHGNPWRHSKILHRCDTRRHGRSGNQQRWHHRVF